MAYEMKGYATGGVSSPAADTIRKNTLLEDLHHTQSNQLSDIHDLALRTHRIADRIIGTRPEAVGKDGPPKTPDSSLLQTFTRNHEMLSNIIALLRDGIERLEAL